MSEIATRDRIESSINRDVAGEIPVSFAGGVDFATMSQAMEFAKIMAISQQAVPKHCRDSVGICLSICLSAIQWELDPFAVANKSYVVNDRVSFESQLVHAVIERRAPITGRLRHRYTGEGNERRCIVWANVKGEAEPLEFVSSKFGDIQPKNSPLWKTKPDLQLFYNASRDWARVYFPDVIMGIYSKDELEDLPPEGFNNNRPMVSMPQAIAEGGTIINADKPRVEREVEPPKSPAKKKSAKSKNEPTPEPVKEEAKTDGDNPQLAEGEVADDNSWDEPPTDDAPTTGKTELFDDGGRSAQKL